MIGRTILSIAGVLFTFCLLGCAGQFSADSALETPAEAPESAAEKQFDGLSIGEEPAHVLADNAVYVNRSPELLARIDSPNLQPLPLIAADVSIVVANHKARILLDLTFFNPTDNQLSGTLKIPLPNRASPSYLAMYQGNGLLFEDSGASLSVDKTITEALFSPDTMEPDRILDQRPEAPSTWLSGQKTVDWGDLRPAVVTEAAKGRQVYESIVRKNVDPVLGEWSGVGNYSARIYPIPPHSFKRVLFAYDQTLVPRGAKLSFPLPSMPNARMSLHDVGTAFVDSRFLLDGQPIDLELTKYGRRWLVPNNIARKTATFEATLKEPKFLSLVGGISEIQGNLVSLLVQPPTTSRSMVTPTGKALIVLDTSYSAKKSASDLRGEMLAELLAGDDSLSHFAIVGFDVETITLTPGFVENTPESRAHYLSLVERIWLEGATDFDTLLSSIESDDNLLKADTAFLFSDGNITWGLNNIDSLLNTYPHAADLRWICYSFEPLPSNQDLYFALTRKNGQIISISQAQDLIQASRAHRYPVSRLDGVFSAFQDEILVAGSPSLVYPGQVLEIAVRTLRSASEIRLILRIDGRDTELRVPLRRTPFTDAIAARAWAEVYVNDLLADPDEATEQAVLALSKHFFLTNSQASYLILETDEEYQQHRINTEPFDFRQVKLTIAGKNARPRTKSRFVAGMKVSDFLSEQSLFIIDTLAHHQQKTVWDIAASPQLLDSPQALYTPPVMIRQNEYPRTIYLLAQKLFNLAAQNETADEIGKPDPDLYRTQALRSLSTIAELNAYDDQALRLTGFVLMSWGMYEDALSVFRFVRNRRPFEPQNLLLEAMAFGALGKVQAFAHRLEELLSQTFPRFESYSRPVAEKIYADLLRAVIIDTDNDQLRQVAGERLRILAVQDPPNRGRLLLFWNLDDTDVDLHVRENIFSEVWYQRKKSASGGVLFWDNTEGLGPEIYEHPKLTRSGFKVYVNYFASSSVEGAAPAAVLIAAYSLLPKSSRFRAQWHSKVLVDVEEDKVLVIPRWTRP